MTSPPLWRKPGASMAALSLAVLALLPPATYSDTIHLRDGRVIRVGRWWEERDLLFYEKPGGVVGIPREDIVRIEPGPAPRPKPSPAPVAPPPPSPAPPDAPSSAEPLAPPATRTPLPPRPVPPVPPARAPTPLPSPEPSLPPVPGETAPGRAVTPVRLPDVYVTVQRMRYRFGFLSVVGILTNISGVPIYEPSLTLVVYSENNRTLLASDIVRPLLAQWLAAGSTRAVAFETTVRVPGAPSRIRWGFGGNNVHVRQDLSRY